MRDVFSVLEGYEGQLVSLPKAARIIGVSRQWFKLESVGFVLMLGGLLLRDLWKLRILIFRHDPNSQFEFGYRDLVEIFIVVVASAGLYVGAKVIMKRFDVE
jgi:hypothetical protein